MKHHHKKKKKSKAVEPSGKDDVVNVAFDESILKPLTDTFSSVSIEEAKSAYNEANGNLNKAAEILSVLTERKEEDKITSCCSSLDSMTNSDEVFVEASQTRKGKGKTMTKKKLVAVSGTVSTMIGKDYVRSVPKKSSCSKFKGLSDESLANEEVEQFLCSMLREDCDLGLAVVRDVLCQCGYDVEKAVSVLLELSASSNEQPKISDYSSSCIEDPVYLHSSSDNLTDRTSDSTSYSSEGEFQENAWFWGPPCRNQSKALAGNLAHSSSSTSGNSGSELPQEILESLFSMPTPKSAEREPATMNWKNVVKKMTSLGQRFESCPNDIPPLQHINGIKLSSYYIHQLTSDCLLEGSSLYVQTRQFSCRKVEGAEYQLFREAAKQHWGSMKSHYQKAATAFSNGQKEYAAYLAEQGRLHNRKAQELDEKASQDIFAARNKNIENMITIDLHGQHVKPAVRLLKLHLLFGAYVRSVRLFRVITGCGTHGVGKSKLKNSVIELLKKERIEWCEENRGTLLIKLNGRMNFSFLDSDDDN